MVKRCTLDNFIELLAVAILLSSVSRGADYIVRPADEAFVATQGVEAAAPLWVWGATLMLFGVTGLCGEVWHAVGKSRWRWVASWTAHNALAAILAVIGASMALDVIIGQGWGWAAGVNLMLIGGAHLLCGYRRRAIR